MAVLDGAGVFTQTNPALQRVTRTPDTLVGRSLTSLVVTDDRHTCRATIEAVATGGDPARLDLRFLTTDGAVRWVRLHLSGVPANQPGDAGEAGGADRPVIVGTFEDVSAEKSAAEKTRSTTRRLQQLVDRANEIIFNIDEAGRFTWVNPAACGLMKRPVDALVGLSFLELVRPDFRAAAGRFYQGQVRQRIPSTYYEFPVVTADGAEIWLGQYVQLIVEDQQVINIQAVARDITARKQTENLLRASEERVRAVVSNAPIILWAADPEGIFTLCEGHGLKGLGIEPSDAVGRKVSDVYTDPGVAAHLRRALAGESFQAGMTLGGPTFDSWYSPLWDANRNINGVMGVAVDITEHMRLSTRVREAEKMEAIGRLAGGVAHDFNNQLTAVLGFAEMLQKTFDEDDPRIGDVSQIIRGGRRAAALTEQLLAFGRKQPRRPTRLNLNGVVSELEPLLQHAIREDVQLDVQLEPELYPVTADEVQIEQVIMNLVLNARDAMPSGGLLTIRTANTRLAEARVGEHPPVMAGPYAAVSVGDTGEGIDPETKAHLFEPFFTTKEQGKGTGMGLASAYGIVQQSGGFIEVESQLGRGSTFTFYLPLADAAAPAPAARIADAQTTVGGSETILFVEDDGMVREMATEALTGAGYTVLEARDVGQALERAVSHADRIDLLLSDVVLPDRRGLELADRLGAERPDLKVLFVTAHGNDATLRGVLDASREVLEKPFGPKDLLRRVRLFLDGTDHGSPVAVRGDAASSASGS
jgi:PAS domain S-box-containing protein